jgi:L-seryl-tRNA(Ser) seleniumtransferase
MFSCDKLLGGPQAGIIAGRSDLIAACSRHPLMRAFRAGGLILSALQETAMAYLRRDGDAIPFWKMVQAPLDELKNRAKALKVGTVLATNAVAGGGALPGAKIPSFGVMLEGDHAANLRAQNPPIIARVNENTTIIDMRTISEEDDSLVSQALKKCT